MTEQTFTDAELRELEQGIAAVEPRPGSLPVMRIRRPRCLHCGSFNVVTRTSRTLNVLDEKHTTYDCRDCKERTRVIFDGSI